MDSQIKWVLGKRVCSPPTCTDALEYVEKRLSDNSEFECCLSDVRPTSFMNIKKLLQVSESKRLDEAKTLIENAVEIMTPEQVGQWKGVRAWQELFNTAPTGETMNTQTYYVRTEDHSGHLDQVVDIKFDSDHKTAVFMHENGEKSIFTNVIEIQPVQECDIVELPIMVSKGHLLHLRQKIDDILHEQEAT